MSHDSRLPCWSRIFTLPRCVEGSHHKAFTKRPTCISSQLARVEAISRNLGVGKHRNALPYLNLSCIEAMFRAPCHHETNIHIEIPKLIGQVHPIPNLMITLLSRVIGSKNRSLESKKVHHKAHPSTGSLHNHKQPPYHITKQPQPNQPSCSHSLLSMLLPTHGYQPRNMLHGSLVNINTKNSDWESLKSSYISRRWI